MVLFPNAKINIGLNIIRKRNDGFHDIETIFYPLNLSDILEIVTADTFNFHQTGIKIIGDINNNLVVKAYRLMESKFDLPPVEIHLHKVIPFGAGLGGGSSDAAYTILALNDLFQLKLSENEMAIIASELGSDCPFFVLNRPVFAEGRGEVFTECDLSFKGHYLVLIKPEINVPTAIAYSKVKPNEPISHLNTLVKEKLETWPNNVINDFELSVFREFPEIENIKMKLYQNGAKYASMSGSGSSVFGIFETMPDDFSASFEGCFVWVEEMK